MNAQTLHHTYTDYVRACVNADPVITPLPFNAWVTARLCKQDERLDALETAQREAQGDGK